ncbi:hypothetical protein PL10110_500025 [Planktothrix agardhii]|nr:hypothetical protein PL10110_500025 [Planktothrix agardhii]
MQPAENNGGLCIDVPQFMSKKSKSLKYA